jgi:ribose transport system substrate-binding protein
MSWEALHVGAETAAAETGSSIYWIAPTREDDIEAQIRLVNRVAGGHYGGLVLAPDQALSLISPVRGALSRGIPTVIICSPLPIPAEGNLSYILNDDEAGGRFAAQRIGTLLKGHGSLAILGLNPDVSSTMIRAHAIEAALAKNYPGIHIATEQMGTFNAPHEQQVAEDALRVHPDLAAIVTLMSTTLDGTLSALNSAPRRHQLHVIGFDSSGPPPFQSNPDLDCLIQEDTRAMGRKAVELIHDRMLGQPVPAVIHLEPVVITPDNLNSAPVRYMLSQDWTLGRWRWSPTQ